MDPKFYFNDQWMLLVSDSSNNASASSHQVFARLGQACSPTHFCIGQLLVVEGASSFILFSAPGMSGASSTTDLTLYGTGMVVDQLDSVYTIRLHSGLLMQVAFEQGKRDWLI